MLYEDVEPFRSGGSVGIGTGPGGGVYISTRQTPPSYFLESVVTVETTTTTNYYFQHDGYYGRRVGSAGGAGGTGGGLLNHYRGGSCHNLQVPKVTTPQSWTYLNTPNANDFFNDDFFHHHRSASHNSNPTKHFQRQRSRSLATAVVPPLLLGAGPLERNSRHGHSTRRSKTPSPKRYVSTSPRSLSPKYNGSRSPSNRSRRSSNTSLGSNDPPPSNSNGTNTKVSPSRVVRQRERAGSMPGHQHYEGGRSPLGSANGAGGRRLSLLTTTKPTINHLINNSSSDDSSSSEGGLLRRKLTKKSTYHVVIIGGANVGKSTLTSYFVENNSKMNSPTAHGHAHGSGEANSPGTSAAAANTTASTTEAAGHTLKRQDYFGLMNGPSTGAPGTLGCKPNSLQQSNNNNLILKVANDPNGQDHLYKYDAIILLYSVTDWGSFEFCKDIIQNSNLGTRTVVLVGNKSDLERSRLVTTEDGLTLASSIASCKFIEISCTLGLHVPELLAGLCTQIQLRSSASCSRSPSPNTSSSSTNTNINGSYYLGGSSSSGISSGSSSLSSSSVLKTSRKMIDKILNRVLNRKWKSCLDFHNL